MRKKQYELPNAGTIEFHYDSNGIGKITISCMDMLVDMANKKPKQGEWIYDAEAYPYGNPCGHYDCDQCGESVSHKTNFCPNCGARMKGADNEID